MRTPYSQVYEKGFSKLILFLFLALLILTGVLLSLLYRRERELDLSTAFVPKTNLVSILPKIPRDIYYEYPIGIDGEIDEESISLILVSTENFVEKPLIDGKTGEKIADLTVLQGVTKNRGNESKFINFAVQASRPGSRKNILRRILQEIVLSEKLDVVVGEDMLEIDDLKKIFPEKSVWTIFFGIEQIDFSDPTIDPQLEFNLLMKDLDDSHFENLKTFVESDLKITPKEPIIPLSIFKEKIVLQPSL